MDPNRFHTIDVIAYSVMSTHLRLVVTAPNELPDHQETARRFKATSNMNGCAGGCAISAIL